MDLEPVVRCLLCFPEPMMLPSTEHTYCCALQLRDIEILCQTPGLQSDKVLESPIGLLTSSNITAAMSYEWQRLSD
jgi:hypothetical protein